MSVCQILHYGIFFDWSAVKSIKNKTMATGKINVSASKITGLPITKVGNDQKVRWNNEPPTPGAS